MSRLLKAQATNELLKEIIKNRQLKVDEEKQWRARDVAFRGLEQRWWAVDKKRLYTDQLVERMSVFSELAAFAAGFQMVMLFELQLPPPAEHRYSHALLAVWGIGSLVVTCTNVCILFLAMLIAIDVLSDSGREPPWSFPRTCRAHEELEKLPPTGCFEDGAAEIVFRTSEQYHERWRQRHERRVMRMLTAFNWSAPFFMFNLGVSTLVKFYMAPSAAWTGFACALCGMLAWWHFQRRKVQYLQAQSASDASNYGRERGMWEPGGAQSYPPDSASERQSLARVPDAPRSDNSTRSQQALGHEQREPLPEAHTRASGQPQGHWHLEPRAALLRRESTPFQSYPNSAPAVGDPLHVLAHRAGLPCARETGGDGEAHHSVVAEPRSDGRGGGGGERERARESARASSIQRRRIEIFDSESAAQTWTAGETLFAPDQHSFALSPSLAPEGSGGGGAGNERGAAGGAEDSRGADGPVTTHGRDIGVSFTTSPAEPGHEAVSSSHPYTLEQASRQAAYLRTWSHTHSTTAQGGLEQGFQCQTMYPLDVEEEEEALFKANAMNERDTPHEMGAMRCEMQQWRCSVVSAPATAGDDAADRHGEGRGERDGVRELERYRSGLLPVSASSPTGAPPLSTLMETDETLAVGHRPLRWGGAARARAQCRSKQRADDVILHDELGLEGQNGAGEEETEFYSGDEGEADAAAR
jgi:hypothetical protein